MNDNKEGRRIDSQRCTFDPKLNIVIGQQRGGGGVER